MVALAPTVPTCANVVPFFERSILKPLSLDELSVHERPIWFAETVVTFNLLGAAGAEVADGVAVGVGVGVGVGLDVEPGV